MKGVLWLAYRALVSRPLISTILALCVGVVIALPVTSGVLIDRFETSLRARATSTPIIAGPDVSRFDLVFASLYFRAAEIEPLPRSFADDARRPGLTVIPLRIAASVRAKPLVGTDDAYYALRALRPAAGELPFLLGEAALGANAARAFRASVGDTIATDPPGGLDLASSSPIGLTVTAILEPAGTPDDDAVFTTLPTAWLAEGILHGHDDPRSFESEEDVIGDTGEHIALSGAVRTYREINETNRASFHFHADTDRLPLTSVIVIGDTPKDETIALARLDAFPNVRALRSGSVVDELLLTVLRIKAAFDTIALLFIATTSALLVLIFWLTSRLRTAETRTIRDIGAARWTPPLLFICEAGMITVVGIVIGLACSWIGVVLATRMLVWI